MATKPLTGKKTSEHSVVPSSANPRTSVPIKSMIRRTVRQEGRIAKTTQPWPSTLSSRRLPKSTAVRGLHTVYLDLLERLGDAMGKNYAKGTHMLQPVALSADTTICQAQTSPGCTAYPESVDIAGMCSTDRQADHSVRATSSLGIPTERNGMANSASPHYEAFRPATAHQYENLHILPTEGPQYDPAFWFAEGFSVGLSSTSLSDNLNSPDLNSFGDFVS